MKVGMGVWVGVAMGVVIGAFTGQWWFLAIGVANGVFLDQVAKWNDEQQRTNSDE